VEDILKFLKKNNIKIPLTTMIGYAGAVVLIAAGYHLIFIVNRSGFFDDEPYQYIINSNTANGYFIIALILVIVGSTFAILEKDK
jgi:hypothetical protein